MLYQPAATKNQMGAVKSCANARTWRTSDVKQSKASSRRCLGCHNREVIEGVIDRLGKDGVKLVQEQGEEPFKGGRGRVNSSATCGDLDGSFTIACASEEEVTRALITLRSVSVQCGAGQSQFRRIVIGRRRSRQTTAPAAGSGARRRRGFSYVIL